MARAASLPRLPSVDLVLRDPGCAPLLERHGRLPVTEAVRAELAAERSAGGMGLAMTEVLARAATRLERQAEPSQRPALNLTGTVLHTNLGRALLAREAVAAVTAAMTEATTLEFDLAEGRRGERDDHVRDLLVRLTGAEDALVVNNNAAGVVLVLDELARRREVVVSRGELIEIGGSFRIPDMMARAGCRLREVGTTNRTHLRDYEAAIGRRTALLMKVHTSNYRIEGFTASVPGRELAGLAHAHGLPLVEDLGSGTLVELDRYGLEPEPTVAEAVAAGVDLVTFSGDKLLGGPQAGIVVGGRELIRRLNHSPLKRALRLDKLRLAALEATLRLYLDPDRLARRLPTLRLLTRTPEEIGETAKTVLPKLRTALGEGWSCEIVECRSQIGSGALPLATLPSIGIELRPGGGRGLRELATALRALPLPVIGRIEDGAMVLDLRCLEEPAKLTESIARLKRP